MRISIALVALTLSVPALADNTIPETPAQWLTRMSDFGQNTLPARDPKAFLGLLNAVSEPSFQINRIDKVTEPALWERVMRTASSPSAIENMQTLATPQTPMSWMSAMTDPRFYEAMMAILSDPGKQARWMAMPMDPASYKPLEKFASEGVYDRWGTAMENTGSHLASSASVTTGNPGQGGFFPFAWVPR